MEEEGEGWKRRERDGREGRVMEEEGEGWKVKNSNTSANTNVSVKCCGRIVIWRHVSVC